MEGENVTGYRLGISHTCTALWYKPPFSGRALDFRSKGPGFNPRSEHGDFLKSLCHTDTRAFPHKLPDESAITGKTRTLPRNTTKKEL